MTAAPRPPVPPALDAATNVLSSLLEARTGQRIAANRAWRLDTTLKPVMRERGFATAEELVAALLDGQDRTIADRVVDALLNQETSFFRDVGVLEGVVGAVADMALPRIRSRIWSAGCSTGQEPLSLAMLLAERAEADGGDMPDIVATDVSDGAITRARAARYTQFEIQRGLPVRRMIRWFDTVGEEWVARPELVRHIAYRRHNLVADPPPPGRFDAILCRNVLMYLAPERRRTILDRLAAALRPGGLVVLGAGETVIGQSDALVPSKRFRGCYEAAPRARAAA